MSVRKRVWIGPSGKRKRAWVANYTDADGKRRLKTFAHRIDAVAFEAGKRPDRTMTMHMISRRLHELAGLMNALADDLMKLGSE